MIKYKINIIKIQNKFHDVTLRLYWTNKSDDLTLPKKEMNYLEQSTPCSSTLELV